MLEDAPRVVQSIEGHLLFASIVWLAASLLTALPRGSATTKYWIWVVTSLNFLLPLSAVPARLWPSPVAWFTPGRALASVTDGVPGAPAAMALLIVLWSLGCVVMMVRLCLRIRAGRCDAQATAGERGPAVVGLLRPRISLPEGIDQLLTRDELRAVFIHELRHARR